MEKAYYSNCLFETVKAKLRNWGDIRIQFIPKKFNDARSFHFIWKNTKTNQSFDFKAERTPSNVIKLLWFKGHIRLGLMEIDENGIKNEANLKIKCWRYFNAPADTDDYSFSVF